MNKTDWKACIAGAALAAALLLAGCGAKSAGPAGPGNPNHGRAVTRLVSLASGGLIGRGEPIRVRFQPEALEELKSPVERPQPGFFGFFTAKPSADQVKHGLPALPSDLFRFSPSISGQPAWEGADTLIFVPDRPFEPFTTYQGSLDLGRLGLAGGAAGKPAPVLSLRFQTRGQELLAGELDLPPESEGQPARVRAAGLLRFSEPTEAESLKSAAALRLDGRRLELSWEKRGEREFAFTSEAFERIERRRSLELRLAAGPLGLRRELALAEPVEARGELSLIELRRPGVSGGAFELKFSEELSAAQDLAGLIQVEGEKGAAPAVTLQRSGRIVSVAGELLPGRTYTVHVRRGIRSRWGASTAQDVSKSVEATDLKPEISFVQSGVFLPSAGNRAVYFKTVNLKNVTVNVTKVFENNLGQFLQTEKLASSFDRREEFNSEYLNRVGQEVASEELEIGVEKNKPLVHRLDLGKLIAPAEKGLFVVSLSFSQDDMIWDFEPGERDGRRRGYSGDEYYSNPASEGYLWAHGRVYKPVMTSDIGLFWKTAGASQLVYATDILSAGPAAGVSVSLKTYQNQTLRDAGGREMSGITGPDGRVEFQNASDGVFYVLAEGSLPGRPAMRSVIKANEMAWNVSSFDVAGADPAQAGTTAYLYTERGVYRPGDPIHFSAIVRNQDGTFPDGHPVTLKVTNPRGQLVFNRTESSGRDGFYTFTIPTGEDDPTGAWRAVLAAGPASFAKNIPVETIVPNRIKVGLETSLPRLSRAEGSLEVALAANYLFGAPAAGLSAELSALIVGRTAAFPGYPGFVFDNEGLRFAPVKQSLFDGQLEKDGRMRTVWQLPAIEKAPSGLSILLEARVLEKGGRATREALSIPVDPYGFYVGLEKPRLEWGYAQIGTEVPVPCVVVDAAGKPASGRRLDWRLYKNERYWWWEYDNYENFKARFKSDARTTLVAEGSLDSSDKPVSLKLKPETWGEYFIEVELSDPTQRGDAAENMPKQGHAAGFFFRASGWGSQTAGKDEAVLNLSADRKIYRPNERAIIRVPSAGQGALLVSIEKGSRILESYLQPVNGKETLVEVPIRRDYIPNVYLSVAMIQPWDKASNDRPIRMYGIVPLVVEDPETKDELRLSVPEVLAPNKDFSVSVQTGSRRPAQVTIAVVDEGLLDLTRFESPNPWKSFYAKQRIGVKSHDLFSQVIGAYNEDVFRSFSIGGADEMKSAAEVPGRKKPDDEKSRRFKPVALFSGVLATDELGRASAKFSMPNYMGSVRVMAVSASGSRYGAQAKAVPVRSDIVLLPTLPRVLGPQEKFVLPVTCFVLGDGIENLTAEVKVEGPLKVLGQSKKSLAVKKGAEVDLSFELETDAAVGPAKVTVAVSGGAARSQEVTDLVVRPSSPTLFRSASMSLRPGDQKSLSVEAGGLPGTNRTKLTIMRRGDLKLDHRMSWLIQYPYGCIEQTTSAAFPQLFLKDFLPGGRRDSRIDRNINAAIEQLKKFQIASGAFSYWPGETRPSPWGTNYAGHFLLEAKQLGYAVPADMLAGWQRHQGAMAAAAQDDMMTRVYRLYLLARAGAPSLSAMNLIKEQSLPTLNDTQRWLLGAAYDLAGLKNVAVEVLKDVGISPDGYNEFGGTYGSDLRDRAIILEAATMLGFEGTADRLFDYIAERVSSGEWYSTQTLGYGLLALGKYLAVYGTGATNLMAGTVSLPSGEKRSFSTREFVHVIEFVDDSNGTHRINLALDNASEAERVFVLLEWQGTPLRSSDAATSENLKLDVAWFDDNGRRLDVSSLVQGTEFWGRFTVNRTGAENILLEELALSQILPAGWEPVNLRLSGGDPLPVWGRRLATVKEDYLDIRDDRLAWFFDLKPRTRGAVFFAKFQAVTEGSFTLPPATAGAMYRNDYRALAPGGPVTVKPR